VEAHARRCFERIAAGADADIDLAEAALWVAAEVYPGLDVGGYLGRLDALADRLRGAVDAANDERGRVEALCRGLCVSEGFVGNRADYYDPRNSYLNEVLERRTGIPITLAIVYLEVAQRLGVHAVGVGFPGHFLCKVVGAEEILIDAFGGRILAEPDCLEILRQALGPSAELDRSHFRAANNKTILARVLTNLKQIHVSRQDFDPALSCCDRLLLLAPDAPLELRDRGWLRFRLGAILGAKADLERFLELAPHHESAGEVTRTLEVLRIQARRVH
jgi:regulator of sirC expression with transglutaminase-like and TPR domain